MKYRGFRSAACNWCLFVLLAVPLQPAAAATHPPCYQKSCECHCKAGNVEACAEWGGYLVPFPDDRKEQGLKVLKQACRSGSMAGCFWFVRYARIEVESGTEYGGISKEKLKTMTSEIQETEKKAYRVARKKCQAGNGRSCDLLANAYHFSSDEKSTLEFWRLGCNAKSPSWEACESLAKRLDRDDPARKDYYRKSLKISRNECNRGIAKSCMNVAQHYRLGCAVEKNEKKVTEYQRRFESLANRCPK